MISGYSVFLLKYKTKPSAQSTAMKGDFRGLRKEKRCKLFLREKREEAINKQKCQEVVRKHLRLGSLPLGQLRDEKNRVNRGLLNQSVV